MTLGSPPDWMIRTVGVTTCRPPTKKFNGAADFASTRPSSIRPLMASTAPTYRSPTAPMSDHLLAYATRLPRLRGESEGCPPGCGATVRDARLRVAVRPGGSAHRRRREARGWARGPLLRSRPQGRPQGDPRHARGRQGRAADQSSAHLHSGKVGGHAGLVANCVSCRPWPCPDRRSMSPAPSPRSPAYPPEPTRVPSPSASARRPCAVRLTRCGGPPTGRRRCRRRARRWTTARRR